MLSGIMKIFGGGSETALDINQIRETFPGSFLQEHDIEPFLQLFTPITVQSINDNFPLNKMIIVADGELAVCVRTVTEITVRPSSKDIDAAEGGGDKSFSSSGTGDEWQPSVNPVIENPDDLPGEAATLKRHGVFMMFDGVVYTPSTTGLKFDHFEVIFKSKCKDKKLCYYQASIETITGFIKERAYLAPILPVVNFNLYLQLKKHPMFSGLSSKQVTALGPLLQVVPIAAGTCLAQEGIGYAKDDDAVMAILLHGTLVSFRSDVDTTPLNLPISRFSIHNIGGVPKTPSGRNGKVVPTAGAVDYTALGTVLNIGSVIGITMCLFKDCVSMKTIVASTDCVVGLLSRKAIFRLASVRCYVMKTMQMNLVSAVLETMRPTVPVLKDITAGEMRRLAKKVLYQTVEAGAHVYKQDDYGDRFFLVVMGEVLIEKTVAGTSETMVVKEVGAGHCFSEVALVVATKQNYTATAKSRCLLISVDGDSFRSVFDAHMDKQSTSAIRNTEETHKVDLIHIVRSFEGYTYFMEFLKQEVSMEGLMFWRAVDRYEDMCNRMFSKTAGATDGVDYHMLHSIALSILKTFVTDGATYQVNIQGTLQKKITANFQALSEAFNSGTSSTIPESMETPDGGVDSGYTVLFKKPKDVVYGLLTSDNYARWKATKEFEEFISSIQEE